MSAHDKSGARLRVSARVQITVEMAVPESWSGDAKMDQIQKQAVEAAVQACRNGLAINGLVSGGDRSHKTIARVVDEPRVTVVMVTEDR